MEPIVERPNQFPVKRPKQFYRFHDLVDARIVCSRSDLFNKQQRLGFPRPIHLADGRLPAALFDAEAVDTWIEQRLARSAQRSIEASQSPERPIKKSPGRPRKHPRPDENAATPEN